MAHIQEVARANNDGVTAASSLTVPVLATTTAGNDLIMAVDAPAGTAGITGFTATDTKGNTWVMRKYLAATGPGNAQIAIMECLGANKLTAGTDTITVTRIGAVNPTRWMALVHEFDDIASFDVTGVGAQNSGASHTTGSTDVPTQSKGLAIAVFGYSGIGNATIANYTVVSPITVNNRRMVLAYRYQDSAAARSATASLDTTGSGCAIIAEFKQVVVAAANTGWYLLTAGGKVPAALTAL